MQPFTDSAAFVEWTNVAVFLYGTLRFRKAVIDSYTWFCAFSLFGGNDEEKEADAETTADKGDRLMFCRIFCV